ncbi:MBL fold metallo-hydrolase [Rhodospirillaceae bacterium SYSU D60014]|uniref:MBL fold metallo-hydrolase n=1 Tax=Virgifigura deserti TaxID=2268457 RepID=UPI000E66DF7C
MAVSSATDGREHREVTTPEVTGFFHKPTFSVTYLVTDPISRATALIDTVLDYDHKAGRTGTESADALAAAALTHDLKVEWILETHLHADHLTAAPYLQKKLGGRTGIGAGVVGIQETFARLFNVTDGFTPDGSQFDHLFVDGERFRIGALEGTVLHTPGHTPGCVSYHIGDAVFVGDALFMPDYGTARCDFPGGDARTLYRSIQRLLRLPDHTRVFTGHDYGPDGRSFAWESSVAAQRTQNKHIVGVGEVEFVKRREARDVELEAPNLILPALQVNMRGGHLPPPEANGVTYLKIPVNRL